jgi:hypothetical protein
MARVRVRWTDTTVTCTGARHQLRLGALATGGLQVGASTLVQERWRRVDEDLVRLVRAVVHLRLAAPTAMPEMVAAACHLAGVAPAEPDPVRAIVRATYPLLAVEVGGRLPSLPDTLPPHLLPAFRQSTPRAAAELLFSGRVTRPVVRAFGTVFHDAQVPDLFTLTVAAGASRHLEPDHVVALLTAGQAADEGVRAPLTEAQVAGVAALAARVPARRAVRLLTEGLADATGRERLRFVVTEGPPLDSAGVGSFAGVGNGGSGGSGGLETLALELALQVVA